MKLQKAVKSSEFEEGVMCGMALMALLVAWMI